MDSQTATISVTNYMSSVTSNPTNRVSTHISSSTPCPSSSSCLRIPFPSFPSNHNRRRFLFRIASMSLHKTLHGHHFPTPQSLFDWLNPRLPSDSFASWGTKPGTKNVHNLWLELHEGESSLTDSVPPVRTVNVVTVRILDDNNKCILVESHQELSDGSLRNRWRPLSEKMKPNETHEAAALRAIKEELGSIVRDCRIVSGSYVEKVEERNSESYLGLPARYVLHSVDVSVDGLPEGDFCTEEAGEYPDSDAKKGVADRVLFVKRHFWKWVGVDSMQS